MIIEIEIMNRRILRLPFAAAGSVVETESQSLVYVKDE